MIVSVSGVLCVVEMGGMKKEEEAWMPGTSLAFVRASGRRPAKTRV